MRSLAFIFIAAGILGFEQTGAQVREVVQGQPSATPPDAFTAGDSIRISGKIRGLRKTDERFVYLAYYDAESGSFTKTTRKALAVNDQGEFEGRVFQPFEGDADFSYKDAFVKLYLKPGGQHYLEIVRDSINRITHNSGAFLPSGDFAELNKLLLKFQSLPGLETVNDMARWDIEYANDDAFKSERLKKLDAELRLLSNFISENNITDQQFINWQRNSFSYSAAKEIASYPFMGKRNKEIMPGQLFKLIETIPIVSPGAENNSDYYHLLNILAVNLQIVLNLNPSYEGAIKANGNNRVPILLSLADSYFSGFAREFVYLSIYRLHNAELSRKPNPANVEWERIEKVIGNDYLKKQLLTFRDKEGKFEPYNVFEKLGSLKAPKALKQQVAGFLKANSGSVVIMDFWADWCGPCMRQMPHYPKLIAAFEGKPVKFLFFSVATDERSMLAIQEKYDIKGTFVNLDKEQTGLMTNIFGLYGYPEHYIMDPTGNVISNKLMPFYTDSSLKNSVAVINRTIDSHQLSK